MYIHVPLGSEDGTSAVYIGNATRSFAMNLAYGANAMCSSRTAGQLGTGGQLGSGLAGSLCLSHRSAPTRETSPPGQRRRGRGAHSAHPPARTDKTRGAPASVVFRGLRPDRSRRSSGTPKRGGDGALLDSKIGTHSPGHLRSRHGRVPQPSAFGVPAELRRLRHHSRIRPFSPSQLKSTPHKSNGR